MPSLNKYFLSLTYIPAVSRRVLLFAGSLFNLALVGSGRMSCFIFSSQASCCDFTGLSWVGSSVSSFKFIWTSGHALAFRIILNVSGSTFFSNTARFAMAIEM